MLYERITEEESIMEYRKYLVKKLHGLFPKEGEETKYILFISSERRRKRFVKR